MSLSNKFPPVMPVISVLYNDEAILGKMVDDLGFAFGKIVLRSEPYQFDKTKYYEPEMGEGIQREWFCFSPLLDPSKLSEWKQKCVTIEEKYSCCGKRSINIDPGYLDHGKLVLASCKSAADKIYMGDGVYAHTCLRYKKGEFFGPSHSFDDFIDGRFNSFFKLAKTLLKQLIREKNQKDQH